MTGYILIFVAVVLFGLSFFFNNFYQTRRGAALTASLTFSAFSGAVGLVALFVINGFSLTTTPFTWLMASCSALNSLLYTFCALYALKNANLPLYSLFAMIGGMALPSLCGLFFYGEPMTVAKGICYLLIAAAIALTVPRGTGDDRGLSPRALLPCFAVFVLNGMSGVLSLLFTHGNAPKASSADYSILATGIRVAVAFVLLIAVKIAFSRHTGAAKDEKPAGGHGVIALVLIACGLLGTVANYFLLLSLADVAGSVQYPLVSGGTIAVSTLLGFATAKKPTRRDLIATAVAVLGMAALLLPV